ncbi:hypothetical protein ACOKW7_11400 [Limnospira platensis CENA597]
MTPFSTPNRCDGKVKVKAMSEIFTGSLIEPVLLVLGSVGFFFFAIQAYRQLEK